MTTCDFSLKSSRQMGQVGDEASSRSDAFNGRVLRSSDPFGAASGDFMTPDRRRNLKQVAKPITLM
eukprot:CAMPEP_0175220272 /NCGR_PEP_ID=MMETSP0093-20121207/19699_1 /TAXON_ID=311494 /ORGANISM="Alexandrium monilatum, Strain CCMP3105" /LENGTH=65 /DNA_ID=CAMNT_0016513775 /DNA_START=254 /DNA_END=451 /DNA_ORIENTATION=+